MTAQNIQSGTALLARLGARVADQADLACGLMQRAVGRGLTRARPGANIGARPARGAALMSELDVIVIHIRAGQAAEYERLFAGRELPRWREYEERSAFVSARVFRAAFGAGRRDDVARYVIAVEVPGHAEHSRHDADPAFQGVQPARRRIPARGSPGIPRTGYCTPSDRPSAPAPAPRAAGDDGPGLVLGGPVMPAAGV